MDDAAARLESSVDTVYHPVRGEDAKTLNLTPRLHKIRDTLKFASYYVTGDAVTPVISINPTTPNVGQTILLLLTNAYQTIQSVVWNFGAGIAEQTAAVANSVSTAVNQVFSTAGQKTITATYKDAGGNVLGQATTTVAVTAAPLPTATITGAISDTVTPAEAIADTGSTDDTTPTLSGTVSKALISGQKVNVYDGNNMFTAVAVVNGTNWTFTPATPLIGGAHSFTVEVADFAGTPSARSLAYVINVLSTSVASIAPSEIMRTLTGSFDIVGRDLPTSGISVTVLGDSKAVCQSPNNKTTTGFGVACTFDKLGAQTLEIRAATKLLGTVSVLVKSNVTGVTWTSASTTNSGAVKFGENVTFNVAGVNLLADTAMGFAVQLCSPSSNEIVGAGSNTQRTFTCMFNNDTGAVAGQMPGVVKDAPGGQVLLDGWNVPVETAAAPPATSNLLLGATVTDSCGSCAIGQYGNPNSLTDGNITTGRNTGTYSGNFTIALATPADIGRISLLPEMTPSGNVTFEIQTSTDTNGAAGTWTSHGGRLTQAWKSKVGVDIALNPNTTGVRLVKLFVYSSPSWVAFWEIQGYSANTNSHVSTASVNANTSVGIFFNVPSNVSTCSFSASGSYSIAPGGPTYSPAGSGASVSGYTMFPGTAGAIIARTLTGSINAYSEIGVAKILTVTAGANMYLLVNDYPNGYADNTGTASVTISCY